MTHATPSPYPRDETLTDKILTVVMWLASVAVAPWILAFPPVSYEGLGLVASVGWGVMVGVGALLILAGNAFRSYVVELPGLLLNGAGISVYLILSWSQVFEGSMGSGARALLMVTFLCWLIRRSRKLVRHHLTLGRIDKIGRGAGDD